MISLNEEAGGHRGVPREGGRLAPRPACTESSRAAAPECGILGGAGRVRSESWDLPRPAPGCRWWRCPRAQKVIHRSPALRPHPAGTTRSWRSARRTSTEAGWRARTTSWGCRSTRPPWLPRSCPQSTGSREQGAGSREQGAEPRKVLLPCFLLPASCRNSSSAEAARCARRAADATQRCRPTTPVCH